MSFDPYAIGPTILLFIAQRRVFVSEQQMSVWSAGSTAELQGSRQRCTGEVIFPAVDASSPLLAEHDTISLGREGVLYSFTILHPNPRTGQQPNALGFVDLVDQPVRIFGHIESLGRPVIGSRYRAKTHEQFGYAFTEIVA